MGREILTGKVNELTPVSLPVSYVWLISLHGTDEDVTDIVVRLTWDEDSYKIFDPSRVPDGTVDIPKQVQTLHIL